MEISRELLKIAKELAAADTTWNDVADALGRAAPILKRAGSTGARALRLWTALSKTLMVYENYRDIGPKLQLKTQIAVMDAQDQLSENMAANLQKEWNILLDYVKDAAIRRRGGKKIHVDYGDVKAVQISNGKWGIISMNGGLNTYTSPEKWLYSLKNSFNFPPQKAMKLFKQMRG